jgi:hypothetical protein
MKRFYVLIIIVLALNISAISQNTFTLQTTTGLPCHYVNLTLTAANFPSTVGAVQLYINIDVDAVQLIGKINGVQSPSVNQNSSGQILIQWNNLTGADINGLFVTLVLHYDGGSTVLDIDDVYSQVFLYTDLENAIPVTFIDGGISEGSYTFNTYYVDKNSPAGNSGNGLSWASAFDQISDVNTLNLKPGEQVQIKPATYNEKFVIRSNAGYAVRPVLGVILSDTNKITFPETVTLSCVDLVNYPDQYYAYVYRSWDSNNGYYKVIEVNDAEHYVRVAGASFIPETGLANNKSKVTAAVGRPVIYKKDPAASESQRVIINDLSATSVAPADAIYIGYFTSGTGQTSADSCNWNIIEGIDINNTVSGLKGFHIQCSKYNVYSKGKIYCSAGTGATGVIITGNSSKRAYYNIIQDNEIYNTPNQGVFIGYPSSTTATNNYAYFNHIIDNNIYLTTGTLAKFNNAIKIQNFNEMNVIEGNNIHDMKILTGGNAAIYLGTNVDKTLIYSNILKNISKEASNTGINAAIMIDSESNKVNVFNNIIRNSVVGDSVYAFRINAKKHTGSNVSYNTIYKTDKAFYLQADTTGGFATDFGINNNIVDPNHTYFKHAGPANGLYTVTYNLFRTSPIGPYYGSDAGNIYGDPLYIDPLGSTIYGLILNGSSPAMDAGIPVINNTTDYFGEFRDNATPTMGAFENTMTCTWTGAISTDWHNYQNWSFQYVPQSDMTVVIPNVTNDPVISLNNVICKSLTLSTGASIRLVSPRTLTIND